MFGEKILTTVEEVGLVAKETFLEASDEEKKNNH